jgi:hypothetical protein
MALEQITTIKVFQGVLADLDELTDSDKYPTGSTFHAIDTGDKFLRYAGGWLPDLRSARAIKQAELL